MSQYLVISVRFLQPWFHGRTVTHEPEWPPTPLRVFQALVASASRQWSGGNFAAIAALSFSWLERQSPPLIVASYAEAVREGYRLFVPENVTDLVTAKWAVGKDGSIAEYRTEKDVRPSRIRDGAEVHVIYPIAVAELALVPALVEAARSITHVGWGIDQVAGNAAVLDEDAVANLSGERWLSVEGSTGIRVRVPIAGTLADLQRRHAGFLSRISEEGFKPVPTLTIFDVVGYRRATDPVGMPVAAFALRTLDGRGFRAFDTVRRTREVAGMLRHAVAVAASRQGWTDARINEFIHGKSADGAKPASGMTSPARFSYLPLPTINPRLGRVEAIRRILITAPAANLPEVQWITQFLAGTTLQGERADSPPAALMVPLSSDNVLSHYVGVAATWTTVTPVILAGYDDRNPVKTERLLRSALIQAGLDKSLVDQVDIAWQGVGFLPGAALASAYLTPENLNHRTRLHVRLRFPQPVTGPLAIGSGRFRGFGLFARME